MKHIKPYSAEIAAYNLAEYGISSVIPLTDSDVRLIKEGHRALDEPEGFAVKLSCGLKVIIDLMPDTEYLVVRPQ